jgi:hypothetical protein
MVYPNPTSNEITFNYALNTKSQSELQLFDVRGLNIKTVKIGTQNSGIYSTEIDVSNLPVGVYYYHFISNGTVVNYGKFLKK